MLLVKFRDHQTKLSVLKTNYSIFYHLIDIKRLFHFPMEAPHEIWFCVTLRFWRSLKIVQKVDTCLLTMPIEVTCSDPSKTGETD